MTAKPIEVVAFYEATSPPTERTIQFPADRSLGRVFVRAWSLAGDQEWKEFGNAQGPVRIDAGTDAKLEVSAATPVDLSPLLTLGEFDLHTVNLSNKGIDDAALANLRNLTGLQGLGLLYTSVTDVGLTHVAKMKRLRWVDMYFVNMTDAGLKNFAGCKLLQHFFVTNAHLSNSSLAFFETLPALRLLHLDNSGVSPEGLLALSFKLKGCEISPLSQ